MPDEGPDGPSVATIDPKAPVETPPVEPPAEDARPDAVTITLPHPMALLRRFAVWIAPPPQPEDDVESAPPCRPRRSNLAKTLVSDNLPRAATITVTILAVVAVVLTGMNGSSAPAPGADPGGAPTGSPFPEPGTLDDGQDQLAQPDGTLSSGSASAPPLAVAVNPSVVSSPVVSSPVVNPPVQQGSGPSSQPASLPAPPAAPSQSSPPSNPPPSPTSGIPARARVAYTAAASQLAVQAPACKLPWTLLAAIGRIESNHGRVGKSTLNASSGRAAPAIYGVRLDGARGAPVVRDTDRGSLDADTTYDRAIGPMQFLPGTWPLVAVDADRDGAADPQDIDDAALTAGRYLCTGVTAGSDLSTPTGQWNAAYRFKRSADYANIILAVATTYATGRATTVTAPPAGATTRLAG